jgi:hypothetical protein
MSFLKYRNGPPAAERQMLHVHEQVFTDLVDERKDVYRRDGFRDQGNKDKTNLTPGQRCLGLSPDKRGLLIGMSVKARHGRNLREARPRTSLNSFWPSKLNLREVTLTRVTPRPGSAYPQAKYPRKRASIWQGLE